MKILDFNRYGTAKWYPYASVYGVSYLALYPHDTIKYFATCVGFYDISTLQRDVYIDSSIFPTQYRKISQFFPIIIDQKNNIRTYFSGPYNSSIINYQFVKKFKTFNEHESVMFESSGGDYLEVYNYNIQDVQSNLYIDYDDYTAIKFNHTGNMYTFLSIVDKQTDNSEYIRFGALVFIDSSSEGVITLDITDPGDGSKNYRFVNITSNTSVTINTKDLIDSDSASHFSSIYDVDYANKTVKGFVIAYADKKISFFTIQNYHDSDNVTYSIDSEVDINNLTDDIITTFLPNISAAAHIIDLQDDILYITIFSNSRLHLFTHNFSNNTCNYISNTITSSSKGGNQVIGYESKFFMVFDSTCSLYRFTESGWEKISNFQVRNFSIIQINNLLYYSTDDGLFAFDLEAIDSFGITFEKTNNLYYDGNNIENNLIVSKTTRTDMNYRTKLIIKSNNAIFTSNQETVLNLEINKNETSVIVPVTITGPGNVDVQLVVVEEFTDTSDRTALLNSSIKLESSTEVTITVDDS